MLPVEKDQTGSKLKRPILDAAIRRIEAGAAAGLIVVRFNRLSRATVSDTHLIIERIEAAGGQVRSVSEDYPDTPEGRMARNMAFGVSRMEWERSSAFIRAAKERAVANGVWPFPLPPPASRSHREEARRGREAQAEGNVRSLKRASVTIRSRNGSAGRSLRAAPLSPLRAHLALLLSRDLSKTALETAALHGKQQCVSGHAALVLSAQAAPKPLGPIPPDTSSSGSVDARQRPSHPRDPHPRPRAGAPKRRQRGLRGVPQAQPRQRGCPQIEQGSRRAGRRSRGLGQRLALGAGTPTTARGREQPRRSARPATHADAQCKRGHGARR